MAGRYTGRAALVVDDDRVARLILRRMLEGLGFEVEESADGLSALRVAARTSIDLVITDLSMPGMDGMEFFRRAREEGLKAPVIFLTAVGSASEARDALSAGASDFIEKPLRIRKLEEAVHEAMSERASDAGSLSIEIDLGDLE
jgi:two-component system chemotaxis response regulator CheY